MKDIGAVVAELIDEARASGDGEAYYVLQKDRGIQVGVVARCRGDEARFYVEVTVQLCPGSPAFDLRELEDALSLLNELSSSGYSMECREGCVICELLMEAGDLEGECALVLSRITKTREPK